jgi:hypothetical protein
MNMRSVLLFIFLLVFCGNISFAQKEKYESLFIYNFTKYIKWPDDYNPDKFVIGVIGESDIVGALETMANYKKTSGTGLPLEVVKYGSVQDIGTCNMLFVCDDSIGYLAEIVNKTSASPVLIITDTQGMASKGAVINFVEQDGKIKFELNESVAAGRNLKVSGSLTSLAILI